jgi:hypothetical protein
VVSRKEASPDITYKVFLNGPYGSPHLLIGYQTVILIVGFCLVFMYLPLLIVYVIGYSGVAFTLSLFFLLQPNQGLVYFGHP